jgi:hypothetical protein
VHSSGRHKVTGSLRRAHSYGPRNQRSGWGNGWDRGRKLRGYSRYINILIGIAGGDGGIRTLDRALQPYNGLANRRLQPLGHISRRNARGDICPTHPPIASAWRSRLAYLDRHAHN